MSEIAGRVSEFSGTPGRNYEVAVAFADDSGRETDRVFLLAGDPDAVVTFDGVPVSGVADLLTRLLAATGRVRATVHPAGERYGAALKAEFTTAV